DRAPSRPFVDGAVDGAPPVLAVARGATRVRIHHRVAGARVDLELVEELVAVLCERSSVDVEEQRIFLALLEPGRTHDPRLDLGTLGRQGSESLGRGELARARERPAHLTDPTLTYVQLGEGGGRSGRVCDAAGRGVVAGHPHVASHHD